MNDALRRSAAHVFIDQIYGGELADDDAHHLLKVLRIRENDVISVSDGRGLWATATLGKGGEVSLLEAPQFVQAPAHRLGVAFVPVKGERPEMVVQKLTEIGIDDVYPLAPSAHSVVKWDGDRADKHHARLVKVAREAAMQSRRVWLPVIHPVVSLADLCAIEQVACAEPGGDALDSTHRLIAVGPEGGFSREELGHATAKVALGESILRAETAAIVAGALMINLRGGER